MDPATAAIIAAAVQAVIQGGIQAATPKKGITPAPDVPELGAGGANSQMDFSALVGQQQSNLPKLQLQNRMPQGY